MIRFVVVLLGVLTYISTASGGEFEDGGAALDMRLHDLDQAIIELDQRLKVLEAGAPPEPPGLPPVTPIEPGQEPLFQNRIPGRIEAEDFDVGDNFSAGLNSGAYFDTSPGNIGGMYRDTDIVDVDIKATGDVDGNFQIGWIADGEWLEYTVGVTAGTYNIGLRVTKNTQLPGSIRVLLGGEELGTVDAPFTGSWTAQHVTQVIPNVTLEAGNKMLRLEMIGGPFDLNWVEFIPAGQSFNRPPCDIIFSTLEEDPLNPGCVDGSGRFGG